MQLLLLFLLLTGPYFILWLLGRLTNSLSISTDKRARVGLTLFFLYTSLGHFVMTSAMAEMIPPAIPFRVGLVYLTGILEVLGAIGVWIPRLTKLTGICLILMLLCFLPANIYSAMQRVDFGGHVAGPAYLFLRIPFQLFVIWWTYYATWKPR